MIEPEDIKRYQRHIKAMILAAGDDPEAFAQVVTLAAELDAGLPEAAAALQRQGFSWRDIGAALGLTRTATHKRYARPAS